MFVLLGRHLPTRRPTALRFGRGARRTTGSHGWAPPARYPSSEVPDATAAVRTAVASGRQARAAAVPAPASPSAFARPEVRLASAQISRVIRSPFPFHWLPSPECGMRPSSLPQAVGAGACVESSSLLIAEVVAETPPSRRRVLAAVMLAVIFAIGLSVLAPGLGLSGSLWAQGCTSIDPPCPGNEAPHVVISPSGGSYTSASLPITVYLTDDGAMDTTSLTFAPSVTLTGSSWAPGHSLSANMELRLRSAQSLVLQR